MLISKPKDELWTRPFEILPEESKADFLTRTHEIENLRRSCKTRESTENEAQYMERLLMGNALKVSLDSDYEIEYWMGRFGLSEAKLREAVRSHGFIASQILHQLSKKLPGASRTRVVARHQEETHF